MEPTLTANPPTELSRLHNDLNHAHELLTYLEQRLQPVVHGVTQANTLGSATSAPTESGHITQAADKANGIVHRISVLLESLAV